MAAFANRGDCIARGANQLGNLRIGNFRVATQDPCDTIGLVMKKLLKLG